MDKKDSKAQQAQKLNSYSLKKKIYETLWYINYEMEGENYTSLRISDMRPEVPPVPYAPKHIIRKAVLDLSGLSVRIEIRTKLF